MNATTAATITIGRATYKVVQHILGERVEVYGLEGPRGALLVAQRAAGSGTPFAVFNFNSMRDIYSGGRRVFLEADAFDA